MEFYAPWCGHCQKLKPEYEKTAKALQGVLSVAAVDCDEHKSLAGEFGIQGFPTIKLMYATSKGSIGKIDYSGGRTASEMVAWAMDQAKKIALKKIGAKSEKQQKSSGGGSGGSGFYGSGSDVTNLGSDNFDEVRESEAAWLVEFYAPWCGHCKSLKPEWEKAATDLKGKVKVGAVDCTAHESLCGEFGVKGFPTLKYFGLDKHSPEDYSGGRDAASIVAFATEKWSKFAPPPEVKELTEQFILEKHCSGSDSAPSRQICSFVFLPHILDSKAEGRNAYLDILSKAAKQYKGLSYGYLWIEGGKQKPLEDVFGVGGFGYPAAVLYSPKKHVYAVLKAGFDYKHFVDFIDGIRHGFEKVIEAAGDSLPAVETTVPWDGKDSVEEIKDEFDLADIMNSEL